MKQHMTIKEYRAASIPEKIQQLEAWIADPNVMRIKPALEKALSKLKQITAMNKTQEALSEVNQLTDEQFNKCMDNLKKPLPHATVIQAGQAALTATQANETQKTYPFMEKVMKLSQYTEGGYLKELFPNTIFERGGLARFHSCIGFLRGIAAAGKVEEAERMAKTLFRSFDLGSSDERIDPRSLVQERPLMEVPSHMFPQGNKLIVMDDGSFLSFSFLYVGIAGNQTIKDGSWEHPGYGGDYNKKYRYAKIFNGGIIFHGLDQNYTVRIGGGGAGWSMHT